MTIKIAETKRLYSNKQNSAHIGKPFKKTVKTDTSTFADIFNDLSKAIVSEAKITEVEQCFVNSAKPSQLCEA